MTWDDLHDATLDHIKMTWRQATVEITINRWLDGRVQPCTARCISFKRLEIPRHLPWGPSSALNEVRLRQLDSRVVAEFELQSGDVIVVEADDITLDGESYKSSHRTD